MCPDLLIVMFDLTPLLQSLKIDIVNFGVVIVLNMMIDLLTPPFGVGLFVVAGISGAFLREMIKEISPMFVKSNLNLARFSLR